MNFNYSYRAFLITSLLVGNLILLLVSVKLTKKEVQEEEVMAVEYTEIEPEILEEDISEKTKIQTNTAFNEAERFISEIENRRNSLGETDPEQTDSPVEASSENFGEDQLALNKAKSQLEKVKQKLEENKRKNATAKPEKSVNRKTTISYRLVDRKALRLPNPVYICDAGGKIVITIEVNELGKIVKATYNETLSTTTNGCLIDSALEYAVQARFSTKADKPRQLGTITYNFPGQY